MKAELETLKKISNEYMEGVDKLGPVYEYQTRHAADHLYNDKERERRVAERNADFNGQIDALAQEAREKAAPVIAQLRRAMKEYMTSSTDLAALTALQGLITAGVALTDAEITAFAEKGGYGVLRLLEKPSRGHIKAPSAEAFERAMDDLERHFRDIGCYRSDLAAISTERPWGQGPTVGNVIMKGMIADFPQKLDELAERWALLEKE